MSGQYCGMSSERPPSDLAVAPPVSTALRAVFGNIEITVPPHLAVEADGNGIFGNFDHVDRVARQPSRDMPVLRIKGSSIFGNVEITMRLPKESARRLEGAAPPRPALP